METKTLFLDVRKNLKAVQSLEWVDLDKGQLDRYNTRPAVTFPCALFTISVPQSKNNNHRAQACTGAITVRIAFDYTGETNAELDDDLLLESIQYMDTVQAVYLSLQARTSGTYSPLERTSCVDEAPRGDGYKVVRLTFATRFLDNSALIEKGSLSTAAQL